MGYIVLLVLHTQSYFVGFRYDVLASIMFALLSIMLLYKAIIVYSQSTCWFALNMILVAILLLLFNILNLTENFYYLFSIIPIISSIIIIAVYANLLYIKVIVLDISISIPIIVFNYVFLAWWWQVVVYTFSIILGIFVCRKISIFRESHSGKI